VVAAALLETLLLVLEVVVLEDIGRRLRLQYRLALQSQ
jgi:hypothetical protein